MAYHVYPWVEIRLKYFKMWNGVVAYAIVVFGACPILLHLTSRVPYRGYVQEPAAAVPSNILKGSTVESISLDHSDSLKISTAEHTSAEPSINLNISTAEHTSAEPYGSVKVSTAESTSTESSDIFMISTAEPTSAKPSDGLKISTTHPTSVEPPTSESVPVEPNTNTSSITKTTFREPVSAVTTTPSSLRSAKNATGIPPWKVKDACGSPLRVIYYVHTAPNNFHMRRFLRYTIGNPAVATFMNSTIAFFVGKTTNMELSEELRAEAEREGDLVLLDHVDTYRNLTLKFIGATKWLAANRCLTSSTDVVVKLDDDVIVNAFLLASYVKRRMAATDTRHPGTIHCAVIPPMYLKPIRTKKSKWFVTKEEYANDTYPPFCSGAAYLMKASVLALLSKATGSVPFFWVDDVYTTGLLRMAQNVTLVNITHMYNIFPSYSTTSMGKKTLFFHWGQTPRLFKRAYRLWASGLRQNLHM